MVSSRYWQEAGELATRQLSSAFDRVTRVGELVAEVSLDGYCVQKSFHDRVEDHHLERVPLVHPLLKRDDWSFPLSDDDLCL